MRIGLVLVSFYLLALGALVAHREWQLWRLRRAHESLFKVERDGPRLESEASIIAQGLGVSLLAQPEVSEVPPFTDDLIADAHRAVAIAGARLGVNVEEIDVVLGAHPMSPGSVGFAVLPSTPHTVHLEGDHVHIAVVDEPASRPAIHFGPGSRATPDTWHWVAAHEVAHHALHRARLGLPRGKQDEERTDIAMALAGYGAIMERVRFQYARQYGPGGDLFAELSTLGTLSLGAIAFVRRLRADIVARRGAAPAA